MGRGASEAVFFEPGANFLVVLCMHIGFVMRVYGGDWTGVLENGAGLEGLE